MIGLRRLLALALLVAGCAGGSTDRNSEGTGAPWPSRAITAARGEITVLPDGRRPAVRYAGWDTRDFGKFQTPSMLIKMASNGLPSRST